MVIYADMVFLLNLCIDFLLLWLTAVIRRQPFRYGRGGIAALIGACYSVTYLWLGGAVSYTLPAKLLVSMGIVWIAFGYVSSAAFLRNLGVFYLISFVTGGGMFALHYIMTGGGQSAGGAFLTQSAGWGSPVSWIFVLLAFPVMWYYTRISFRSLQEKSEINQFLTPIVIVMDGARIQCMGLVDTGNQLRDPMSRDPVVMVEWESVLPFIPESLQKIMKSDNWWDYIHQLPPEWTTRIRIVPYRSAGNDGKMLLALKPDHIEVKVGDQTHVTKKVLLGLQDHRLSSDGTYQAIIHPSCMPVAGT
ncbi:sigma-E processing peptidase SpoIIGA [Mechercharimyces sp. CAU 1602]|uniref:sigma-E processing peptidase SpoIIGA n=1 Tax=Mechercharimyces sp. CAU 1602 TaxID=2973933 RepID=UPI0021638232|nr:sigma-E processing peptidase SpoIIGA [Mechercharimyces sp. CAU 1602]MCS1350630.1 sigma-E processing peptidase SpoIIGA [Mechercharimyces sp. CAU 1602]